MGSKRLEGRYDWYEAIEAQGNGCGLPNTFELLDIRAGNTDDEVKATKSHG